MRTAALSIVIFALSAASCAQEPQPEPAAEPATTSASTPATAGLREGWQTRLDREMADVSTLAVTPMAPGWHITTGPAGIFWQEGMTAAGEYVVSTTTHLFPSSGHHEAFGLFLGGKNLEAGNPAQSYVYFVIRGDGKFLIKRRDGAETTTIQDWTESAAINPKQEEAGQSVENILAVAVAGDVATFSVNGQPLATVDRSTVDLDGQAGLRINHRLNLHVTDLTLTK